MKRVIVLLMLLLVGCGALKQWEDSANRAYLRDIKRSKTKQDSTFRKTYKAFRDSMEKWEAERWRKILKQWQEDWEENYGDQPEGI